MPTQDAPPARGCRYCASDLRPGAIYCTTCSRFQSRWQALLGGVTLSAVLSVIPVVTLAYAFLRTNVILPRSRIDATVLSCTQSQVRLAVSNSGNRGAMFLGGSATLDEATADPQSRKLGQEALLLNPGDLKLVDLAMLSREAPYDPVDMPLRAKDCRYRLTLDVLEVPRNTPRQVTATCACEVSE